MMILTKELTMEQPSFDSIRLQRDLCGPYISDERDSRPVRCYLQIAHSTIPLDVPAEVLRTHRLLGGHNDVTLRVPGEELASVEVRPIQTKREQQLANRWLTEMQDFDRF